MQIFLNVDNKFFQVYPQYEAWKAYVLSHIFYYKLLNIRVYTSQKTEQSFGAGL